MLKLKSKQKSLIFLDVGERSLVLLQLNVTVFSDSHGKLYPLREDAGWAGGGRGAQKEGWEELWLEYKMNKKVNTHTRKDLLILIKWFSI